MTNTEFSRLQGIAKKSIYSAGIMGLLPFEESINERDLQHGHRRVYNPETFRRDFLKADYRIEQFGGYWLKPLTNDQMEQQWTPEMIEAFMQLGERYPDVAGELYIIASVPNISVDSNLK